MFLDSSAIVELLDEGPEAKRMVKRIKESRTPLLFSPMVVFEATSVLSSKAGLPVRAARDVISRFLNEVGAGPSSITPEIGEYAIQAMAQYGKGRGHPARLNFGDCFSYACAKAAGVPLLYVGDDFSKTDLA